MSTINCLPGADYAAQSPYALLWSIVSEAKPRELSLAVECGRATAADLKYQSPLVDDSTLHGPFDARFQEDNTWSEAIA